MYDYVDFHYSSPTCLSHIVYLRRIPDIICTGVGRAREVLRSAAGTSSSETATISPHVFGPHLRRAHMHTSIRLFPCGDTTGCGEKGRAAGLTAAIMVS